MTKFQKPEKYPIRWMVFFLPYEMEVKNKHTYSLLKTAQRSSTKYNVHILAKPHCFVGLHS